MGIVIEEVDGEDVDVASRDEVHMHVLVDLQSDPKGGTLVFCVLSQLADMDDLALSHLPVIHKLFSNVGSPGY